MSFGCKPRVDSCIEHAAGKGAVGHAIRTANGVGATCGFKIWDHAILRLFCPTSQTVFAGRIPATRCEILQ
jgi:hypothetical protein